MRVNEIFYSLQGEGYYAGTAAVFVRFAGCNCKCSFCDTDFEGYEELTICQILDAVCQYPAKHVVLTGGEPTLQITRELLDALHAAGRYIQIETNGTVALKPEVIENIDWVTCSPKADIKIQRIDEIKLVYTGPETEALIEKIDINAKVQALQPCDTGDLKLNNQLTAATIEYIKSHPNWRLSIQTHKLLCIP